MYFKENYSLEVKILLGKNTSKKDSKKHILEEAEKNAMGLKNKLKHISDEEIAEIVREDREINH